MVEHRDGCPKEKLGKPWVKAWLLQQGSRRTERIPVVQYPWALLSLSFLTHIGVV